MHGTWVISRKRAELRNDPRLALPHKNCLLPATERAEEGEKAGKAFDAADKQKTGHIADGQWESLMKSVDGLHVQRAIVQDA